jgi:ferredoxin-NADP reductase
MPKFIDTFLNKTTMYRLALYYLLCLLAVSVIFGAVGVLPYSPVNILFSTGFFVLVCALVNWLFAKVFRVPANVESTYITALILVFLITPPSSIIDTGYFSFAIWASIWAMATKYMFAIRKKHLFNPAGIAVVITMLFLGQSASWWVGTAVLFPFVFIGGLLLTKKIVRFDLVISFVLVALLGTVVGHLGGSSSVFYILEQALLSTPLFFFAFVMLTEPLTTPPTRKRRILYGAVVGMLFYPAIHISSLYLTPELALVFGNVLAYFLSSKERLVLTLKNRILVADSTYHFVFTTDKPLRFHAGQYLEWTLPAYKDTDTRGNRRYFTIASSPTEKEIAMGVKFYPEPSTFKKTLMGLSEGDTVTASSLSGDFTLPKDLDKKIVCIAGGIGVTPFRSMVQYLLDTKEKRDIVLFYSNKTASDIAYRDVFDRASREGIMKVVYALTDKTQVPDGWTGHSGYVDGALLMKTVPDFKERLFYLSGPRGMVETFEKTLRTIGVPRSQIKTDYFPGFA